MNSTQSKIGGDHPPEERIHENAVDVCLWDYCVRA